MLGSNKITRGIKFVVGSLIGLGRFTGGLRGFGGVWGGLGGGQGRST